MLADPVDRDILHFTHVSNLMAIMTRGFLLADSGVGAQLRCEVGDRGIKAARRELDVTRGPGGHPCDYVPFYFAPRSPMLYKIAGNGNCGAHLTEYFDDLSELDTEVDWPIQAATMWNSTADDPTRATRRAAEFLVHQWMPWTHVRDLTVRTRAMANLVGGMLTQTAQSRPITVRPEWYYQGSRYR